MNDETHAIRTAINAGMFEAYGFEEGEDFTITNENSDSFVINYNDCNSVRIVVIPV